MKIIGLGSYSRVGKDTFADAFMRSIVERDTNVRVNKIPFAWKLKQIAHELYAWDGMKPPEFYDTEEGAPYRDVILPNIGKTPVEIWVSLGTPAVRDQVYDETWIDYVLKSDHGCDILIVPDVRFPNEVERLREHDAVLCKAVRPGYGPRNTVADRSLLGYDGWDYYLGGGDTILLQQQAWMFADWFLGGHLPHQSKQTREYIKSKEVVSW